MILGLDQSASNTGWCLGDAGGPVQTGSLPLPPFREDIGGLLLAFESRLVKLLDAYKVDLIVFEKPVRPFAQLHLETARKLYGIAGLIELEAKRREIPVREVSNTEAKKLCYGNGGLKSAEAKKVAMPRARLWGVEVATHDAADAFAVWLCAVRAHDPDAFKVWEARRRAAGAEAGEALL